MADPMTDERLRDQIAERLAEWAFQAAEAKGVKLTSFHRHVIEQEAPVRADMVMTVVQPELERLCTRVTEVEAFADSQAVELREAGQARQAEVERLREQLAAFVPPGTLGAGETPALCGTCKDRLCVPGLPGCTRCVKAEVERLRAEQVIDRQALDRAAADHAQLRVELVDTVGEARSDIAGLESLARRLRTAWESARNGRRSARRLNAELVRSMDMLRAELAETTHALEVTGEKVTALRKQRDTAEAERNTARAELATVLKNYEGLQGTAIRLEGERDEARVEIAEAIEEGRRRAEYVRQIETERDAVREQVKDIAAEVAAWENGTTAPHDALTAIRDRATGAAT